MKAITSLRFLFATMFLFGAGALASAATMTWTNTTGGNWNVAANWNPNQVPGASDTAVITNSAVTVTLDVSPTVGGIILGADAGCGGVTTLLMNGQTLTLDGPLAVGTCGHFTLNTGTLKGTANATLSGTMNWPGGYGYAYMAGTLTLATNGTLNIQTVTPGYDYHDMPAGSLINNGTVVWTGGPIRGGSGTVIQNNGLWIAQVTNEVNSNYGAPAFNNSGTFDVQSGTVTLGLPGTNSGTFQVAAGATCNFTYPCRFNGGTAFTGTGTNRLSGVRSVLYTVDGSITSQNLELAGGTLLGTNNATLGGVINWPGGYGEALIAGTLTLATNSTLNILTATPGYDYHDLPFGSLINNGTVVWTGGPVRGGTDTVIQNNGVWIAQVTNEINSNYGSAVFNNSGTFDVQSGTATLRLLGTSTGTFNVAPGATCDFTYPYTFSGGTAFTGTGTNRLNGAGAVLFTVDGSITIQNLELAGGTLLGTNNATLGGVINWSGGSGGALIAGTLTLATNSTLNILPGTPGNDYHDLPFGNLINNGTVVWTGGPIRGGTGTLIQNNGLWIAAVTNEINGNYGPAVFNNSGTFNVQSGAVTINTAFTNPIGTLSVSGGSVLQFTQPLVLAGGLLTGSGTIQAPSVASAALVSPGATNAVLTISGNYSQLFGGSIAFDIGGTSPGTNQSQVKVTGRATLDGLVSLRYSPGYLPAMGSSNIVLTASSVTGQFHCFDYFLLLGQNERMLASFNPTDVTLTPALMPDPSGPSLAIQAQASPSQTRVCWPSEFPNFGLYYNTNLNQANWLLIPGATNRFIEIPSLPVKFFRLRYND